jgi:UDP-N-acetylmuramate: L-alanyl-gamma-D-glutamyl-meso-diaminopimelate ligase
MSALRHVHFIAIGGTGMGSLAGLLHERGIEVTGSDGPLYPPMSTALADWGIEVVEGYRPENVLTRRPDLVVIGNAVRAENPEARAAMDAGIPYQSFSDALYDLAISTRHCVAVTGTHGKTTTTSLVAHLLHSADRDPSFLVGGIARNFGVSFREGHGEHFVVEGDEYDTAFFDKTPKFLHYHPDTTILTSVEFDHADIYRDLEHVKTAFRKLVSGMDPGATLLAAGAYSQVREVAAQAPCRVIFYAVETVAPQPSTPSVRHDYLARELESDARGTRFVLEAPGEESRSVFLPLHGRFNVENALAALAAVHSLGVGLETSIAGLGTFLGVRRRQELRGVASGVTVIDDFAHHPTAVRGSIEALRARYPSARLWGVFEPRTNTSRRKIFQEDYARALAGADRISVLEVSDEEIYSATGEVDERLSAAELVTTLIASGLPAAHFARVDAIVEELSQETRAGDVVLVMSNGSFGNIWEKLLSALESRDSRRPSSPEASCE